MRDILTYENIEEKKTWEEIINKYPEYHNGEILGFEAIELPGIQNQKKIEEIEIEKMYPYSTIKFPQKNAIIVIIGVNILTKSLWKNESENNTIFINKTKIENINIENFEKNKKYIQENNTITIRHESYSAYESFESITLLPITKNIEKNMQYFYEILNKKN